MPSGEPPRPFTYEQFLEKYDLVLAMFTPEQLAYFEQQADPADPDRTKRLLYAACVTKMQYPEMPYPDYIYVLYYRIALDFLALGATKDQIMGSLRAVGWDSLPRVDGYSSETGNSIATRAYEDAVAGVFRGPIMQSNTPQVPPPSRHSGEDFNFQTDTGRF